MSFSINIGCFIAFYYIVATHGHLLHGANGNFIQSSLETVLSKSCVVMIPDNLNIQITHPLFSTFADDPMFAVEYSGQLLKTLNSSGNFIFKQKSGRSISYDKLPILLIEKVNRDRSCLLKPTKVPVKANYHTFLNSGSDFFDEGFIRFVNEHCFLFRNSEGNLNGMGIHRQYILDNFYQPQIPQLCEEVHAVPVSGDSFFKSHVQYSKPVIFRNAMRHWPATSKWTNAYFRSRSSKKKVHIKLAPFGEFEGVDDIKNWEDYRAGRFLIPDLVLKQLPFPDLVVVRPASAEMTLSEFIDYLENKTSSLHHVTAYLEYASLKGILPDLMKHIEEPDFAASLFTRRHTNIWFSDGNTVGKLHFDPFDNLLCQISGSKELTLFPPFDNSKLYEGHITEARLSFDAADMKFQRKHLLDSTSMVMSPIDITKPDLVRFPKYREAVPLSCTINEGDVLYLPAFWWHEVRSRPSPTEHRNLAVNFWYEPFLKKEFPCQNCPMDVNPFYLHLL